MWPAGRLGSFGDVVDCQNYGPFLGPYYNTGPNTGPNLGDPKRDHNFGNPPCGLAHDELGTAESVLACAFIGDSMGTTLGLSCHMPHKALLGM